MVETFDCTNTNLKYGSKGKQVTLLQTHLKDLGYYTYYNGHYLKIDGEFKQYTEKAVKAFQKATGHTQDGWFGEKTCKSLNEKILQKYNVNVDLNCSNIDVRKGSTNTSAVKKIQEILHNLGYYTRQVDGNFGDYTYEAVKKFQKDVNVQETGVVDSTTCTLLKEYYSNSTNTNLATSKVVQAVDPNKADTSKSLYSINEANIGIDGLYFIASSIEPKTPFNNSEWKKIDTLNGKFKFYKGHPAPMEWTVELYLHKININNLRVEFEKMQNRVCKVVSDDLISGNYVIDVNYSTSKGYFRKVTLNLVEYLV